MDQWLLLHKRDQYAVEGWDPADYPQSVLSGRTNDEVKADPQRVWRSDLPPAQASVPVDGTAAARGPSDDEPTRWAASGAWASGRSSAARCG